MRVVVLGASKVGKTLASALAARGHDVTLRARRRGPPRAPWDADLVVIATRDGEIAPLAAELAERRLVTRRTAVVHTAGALGPEVLSALRGVAAGIGQAHPFLSFAAPGKPPSLGGALLLVTGDTVAVRRATRLGRALGMVPRAWPSVNRALYHAAAALVANGAAALAQGAATLLAAAGAPPGDVARALGPMLRSVAENVARVGLPAALTGPVRRGDATTIASHLDGLRAAAPELVPLYRESALAQLVMARALGDAQSEAFDAVERLLRDTRTSTRLGYSTQNKKRIRKT
jgi:predicted short-subunit dehydrogenase-like oxidoreductase (DUF2520 family)